MGNFKIWGHPSNGGMILNWGGIDTPLRTMDFNLIDPTISQINETALANILLYDDSNKITSENILYDDSNKITSENSNILQSTIKYVIARIQSDLMNHSSKGHTYMHALLYYIYIYIDR